MSTFETGLVFMDTEGLGSLAIKLRPSLLKGEAIHYSRPVTTLHHFAYTDGRRVMVDLLPGSGSCAARNRW